MGLVIPGASAPLPGVGAVVPGATAFLPRVSAAIPGFGALIPTVVVFIPCASASVPGVAVLIPAAGSAIPTASLRNVTAASSPRAPMTVDEWAALEEDVPGELVDGVLVEEEMPSLVHERIVWWLLVTLTPWLTPRDAMIFPSGVKLAIRPRTGRMADAIVYLDGRKAEPYGAVRVPPDIAIEVVSPEPRDERRDRVEQPDDYAIFGVRWYWLVDPELRSFEIWELGADGRYVRACGAIGGKIDPVPGCDGLALDVDPLWEEVDRLLT
jgi:Uma2 family endonuclease